MLWSLFTFHQLHEKCSFMCVIVTCVCTCVIAFHWSPTCHLSLCICHPAPTSLYVCVIHPLLHHTFLGVSPVTAHMTVACISCHFSLVTKMSAISHPGTALCQQMHQPLLKVAFLCRVQSLPLHHLPPLPVSRMYLASGKVMRLQ